MSTDVVPESPAAAGLRSLARRLAIVPGFAEVLQSLAHGHGATLDGAWGSSRALAIAELLPHCPATMVVVVPRADEMLDLADDLRLFSDGDAQWFPLLEEAVGSLDESYVTRLRLLKSLLASPPRLVLTCVQALLQPVPAPDQVRAFSRAISVGDEVHVDEFLHRLVDQGFVNTTAVELPGEFSIRGGIVDVFSPDAFEPVRIEFFGDEVASLRRFDPSGQRSLTNLDTVEITLVPRGVHYSSQLADYLGPNSWFFLVEPQALHEEAKFFARTNDAPDSIHGTEDVWKSIYRFPSIAAGGLVAGSLETTCRLPIESIERFSGDLTRVRDEIDTVGQGQQVYLVCQNEAEERRLREIFGGTRLAAEERLHFVHGRLGAGFRFVPDKTIVVGGGELFQRGDPGRATPRRLGRVIDSFLDLREGDLVVHLGHGIARYHGLRILEQDGHVEEHLELEFHGGTRIFVPSTRIELVQKYVGGTKARPTLAKIGGKSWQRQKMAAAAAVEDLAAEMLELQAKRSSKPGIKYPADSRWQQEFDASFPYQETADQLASMEAIKRDMAQDRPMDRLLCGDVGFGKTELAMRAAFKAVDAGYQVAVLVPTTILAEQHRRTFSQRMAEYPFSVAALSRFCTREEELRVLEGLAEGTIDLVIGTHRLAQSDILFKNLGLLIIDEEQRFGVAVKERLKSLRASVDVLTMTATPIPRTLHLSLLGIRDISSLETPPEDRVAVETRISRWDPDLIRHAIVRELGRGGQLFFVHNRVHDIDLVAQKILRIVPEVRLEIGHGQMPEHELERVMLRFVEHKFDLLLATTIIESGLDIPNANTIFIDEADHYGLADLHQLRGRVGRYKHRAYCYLLVDEHKSLTSAATKRLRAIEEYSSLGAGFSIAMKDLEIRGAGNILGTQQSGHIAAVGYELYCALLEAAVRRLKHLPTRAKLDVQIDLPGSAYLPRSYVPDVRHKIDLYRRLARIEGEQELEDMRAELIDRFGPPPGDVLRLIRQCELRLMAAKWGIRTIRLENEYMVFQYVHPGKIRDLIHYHPKQLRIVDEQSAYFPLPRPVPADDGLWELARNVLDPPVLPSTRERR